jgi:diacylglycerol kinase family enzyme
VDLGRVNDRHFTFSSGIGLDASVVERVDSHPRVKARAGEYYFTYVAITTFARRYLVRPPRMVVEVGGEELTGVTTVVQNSTPYTYFSRRPIELADSTALDSGTLAAVVLRRANPVDMPTVMWRAFSRQARMSRHRQVRAFDNLDTVRVRSADERPLPVQVDGDYIGDVTHAEYGITPRALAVVS